MTKTKKAVVKFTVGDGIKPNRVGPGRVFNLMCPLKLNLPPGAEMTIGLDLSCNYPLHIFQTRSMLQRGLTLPDGLWACVDADTDLRLTIKNNSKETQLLDRKDVLARAFILDNNDLEVEE